MSAASIITHLYSLVGLMVVVAYIPQIIRLATATGRSLAISIPTFAMWSLAAAISLSYGIVVLEDWRFCVIESANLTGYLTIIAMTVYNRYFRFGPPPRSVPQAPVVAAALDAEAGLT